MKYSILLSLLILGACENNINEKFKKDTNLLNTYFENNFSYSVNSDSIAFIMVATSGCSGCLDEIFNKVKNNCLNNNVNVIVSAKTILKYDLEQYKSAFWIDTSNSVDKLVYHKGNVAIIWFNQKKIVSITPIEPNQINQLLHPLIITNSECATN